MSNQAHTTANPAVAYLHRCISDVENGKAVEVHRDCPAPPPHLLLRLRRELEAAETGRQSSGKQQSRLWRWLTGNPDRTETTRRRAAKDAQTVAVRLASVIPDIPDRCIGCVADSVRKVGLARYVAYLNPKNRSQQLLDD